MLIDLPRAMINNATKCACRWRQSYKNSCSRSSLIPEGKGALCYLIKMARTNTEAVAMGDCQVQLLVFLAVAHAGGVKIYASF